MSWKRVQLKDIGSIVTGSTPSKSKSEYYGSDIPFISPGELGRQIYVDSAKQHLSYEGGKAARLLPVNTVMVCCIGSLGKTSITSTTVATNQQINSIIVDESIAYPLYVYFYCLTLKKALEAMAPATTVAIVNKSRFSELEIPLPPLPVQKQIAAVLEKADTLRSQCQQMEQALNSLAQSVFLDMFGDPVNNPNAFPVKEISEVIKKGDKVNYGVVQPGDDFEGGSPLIRISDFYNEKISLENLKYINPEIDKKHQKSKLKGNEVLIACVGATIGKLALATKDNVGMNIARAVVRVCPNEEITPYYLLNYLKSPAAQMHFLKETRAVGQPTLNVSLIASCPVLIPPLNLQVEFQRACESIQVQISQAKKIRTEFDELFQSLMQRAFKGELALKDVA